MSRSTSGIFGPRLLVGCLAAAACGDSSAPAPTTPVVETRVVSMARAATPGDTIDAIFPDAVTIAVRDGKGAAVANASVRLEWSSATSAGPVSFAPSGSTLFAGSILVATDGQGNARASVRLGRIPGAGFLVATETSKSVKDSIALSVAPGAFFRSTIAARDTAMLVGGTITLAGKAFDRADNQIPLTLTVSGTECTVGSGGAITGASAGTCQVSMSQPAGASFRITVIPDALMLENGSRGLASVRLSGSQRTPLSASFSGYTNCSWVASGNAFACVRGAKGSFIDIVRLDGTIKPVNFTGVDDIGTIRMSRDRQWLVFSGYPAPNFVLSTATLYRVRVDGSQLTVISPACCSWITPTFDVSPDGRYVIYSSFSTLRWDGATGTKSTILFGRERYARFSPDGSKVAYLDGAEVFVSDVDGSNVKSIYTSTRPEVGPYFLHLEWSPDSRWLLTLGYGDRPFIIAADGSATLAINATSLRNFLP